MKFATCFVFIALFVSCFNKNDGFDYSDNRLLLPDSVLHINSGVLHKLAANNVLYSTSPSIITTIWGDCHVCMSKFNEWKNLRKSWGTEDVHMVFIVTTEHPEYFLKVFYPEIEYSGLLLVDSTNDFYTLNHLQQEAAQQNTFLVDSTFRIVLQGDPLLKPSLQEKYKETIEKIRKR